MKSKTLKQFVFIGMASLFLPMVTQAATIWNGPPVSESDATEPDQITARVWLTRGSSEGLYNAVTETGFTHFFSPADTEWADGTTANYASLSYTDWNTWAKNIHGGPPNTVGVNAVVHLITDDIYIDIMFTSWSTGGSYSYQRATPPAADVPPTIAITSPTNGASFAAPGIVSITASASDSDGSVTNVAFFDGATFLGQTNNTPYTVTASLAAGSHALTAVATDNAGLSTTSAIVNVTVSAANVPPTVTITNPPNNAVFGNTDTITVQTSASDSDGTVTNVQLFNGTNLLRSFTNAPYNFSGTALAGNFALGTNILTAVAKDNLGATTTSAPVHVIVARYTAELTNGAFSVFLIPVATNLSAPLYGVSPPSDTHRLFVLEQNGLMWIIQDGVLLPAPALDLRSLVQPPLIANNANDERGLLGMAFHPGFNNPASLGYRTVYTYNSELIPSNTLPTYPLSGGTSNLYKNALNEWKISITNANVIDPSTRREIISFGKNALNHNGGTCTFGPDGYMYLALGDGGNANDVGPGHISPGGNAQNLSVPLGKMLRLNPLNPALNPSSSDPISSNGQYRIPASNPFQGPGQVPEIYAYGFRNPYRFDFDPVTGDLIEADVGQNNIEEINRVVMAGNYGWAIKEGDFLFNMTNGTVGTPPGNFSPGIPTGLIDPISGPKGILEYDHNNGISITGGFVYRGAGMPELYGKYIFGDLALVANPVRENGRLFYADLQQGTINAFTLPQFGSEILPNGDTVHGFGQDGSGELYAMATDTPPNGNGGVVYKLASLRLTLQENGNQLDISWPTIAGHLQAQTNNSTGGLGTNWVNVPGSAATNHVTVSINPSNGSVFYRLVVP
ncbi:MAG TPA: Ig-like domain-containing protein [Verrucomicrobiae bacterium]|nr:Ig-like domain-containing protein [Verrucomicrobiae bacterium]